MSLTLHKFGPIWGLLDFSAFCLKLETYLKLAGSDYTTENFSQEAMKKSPKGKFPFVIFEDGEAMGDSNFIIDELISRGHTDLDAGLSKEEKAISLAFRRLLDENLYWVGLYSRWVEEDGWAVMKPIIFGGMPAVMRDIVANRVRKSTFQRLDGHGMNMHSRDEVYQVAEKDIDSLSDFLGKKTFFFGGKKPTLLDACVYAYTANFLKAPIDNPAKAYLSTKKNLVAHCDKIHNIIS